MVCLYHSKEVNVYKPFKFEPAEVKYPESILAIRRTALRDAFTAMGSPNPSGFMYVDFMRLVRYVQHALVIGQRQDLDEAFNWGESFKGNRDYAQWLNYFVVENADGEIYPYMRSREGSGESDLRGRGSIAPGGHCDLVDIEKVIEANGRPTSIIDPVATAINNIYREAFEEMTFYVNGEKFNAYRDEGTDKEFLMATTHDLADMASVHFEGLIFDNSDNVGRLHLAFAWRMRLKPGVTIGNREKHLDFIDPVRVTALHDAYPHVTFENWSKIFAEHLSTSEGVSHDDLLQALYY